VQADRRFVEHVKHAGQPGADLAGQTIALTFAPDNVAEPRDRVR
jgi:hypothetical protein